MDETWLPNEINPNLFPAKLWYVVNSRAVTSIRWNDTGDGVLIEQKSFEKQFLTPESRRMKIFRTTRFHSFVRQLHLYGFRAVCGDRRFFEVLQLPAGCYHYFENPCFKRHHPEGVANLIRFTTENKLKLRAGLEIKPQRRYDSKPPEVRAGGPVDEERLNQGRSSVCLQPDSTASHSDDSTNLKTECTETPVPPCPAPPCPASLCPAPPCPAPPCPAFLRHVPPCPAPLCPAHLCPAPPCPASLCPAHLCRTSRVQRTCVQRPRVQHPCVQSPCVRTSRVQRPHVQPPTCPAPRCPSPLYPAPPCPTPPCPVPPCYLQAGPRASPLPHVFDAAQTETAPMFLKSSKNPCDPNPAHSQQDLNDGAPSPTCFNPDYDQYEPGLYQLDVGLDFTSYMPLCDFTDDVGNTPPCYTQL